ncbi:MAG: small multi-drug export protein [Spirochaetia bacterium]|nr:small multi-drug export protein [Spirochaetia bacterium]
MTLSDLLITGLLSIAPISELRGAIPFALAKGMPVIWAYFFCVVMNFMASVLVLIFLNTFHKVFCNFKLYRRFFDSFIEKARKKVGPNIDKYGTWGLAVFVAVPLPVTGAITGTLGAWVLGMKKRQIFPAILAGVAIAGIIVSVIAYYGIEAFAFFTKQV